jgi:hypothetical protein
MKTTILKPLTLSLMLGSIMSFNSCKKEVKETLSDMANNGEDEQTEMVSDNIDNISEAAVRNDNSSFRLQEEETFASQYGNCAILKFDTLNSTDVDTITIDFGNGCQGNDGRTRKGKIIVYQTLKYRETGSVRKITFDNFYVNNNKVEGERIITNKGKNANNQTYWSVVANNMKITRADGKIRTWSSNRTRTIIAGESTPQRLDDEFQIEGTATGVNGRGENFTLTITSPLIKSVNCRWIKKGTIVVAVTNKPDRTIDYGDGSCDDQAVLTIKNKTKNITLR